MNISNYGFFSAFPPISPESEQRKKTLKHKNIFPHGKYFDFLLNKFTGQDSDASPRCRLHQIVLLILIEEDIMLLNRVLR